MVKGKTATKEYLEKTKKDLEKDVRAAGFTYNWRRLRLVTQKELDAEYWSVVTVWSMCSKGSDKAGHITGLGLRDVAGCL